MEYPKVAIVYLSYHSDEYLAEVVSAFEKITYPKDKVELIIVDNPHPEFGYSKKKIDEVVMPKSGIMLPKVAYLPQAKNGGFADGNNAGIAYALEHGAAYVFLHNQDGTVAPGFLEPLVEVMQKDETVGAVQSLVLLKQTPDLINTAGNSVNYIGVGYCTSYKAPRDLVRQTAGEEIGYASGAAVLLRADLLKKFGSWFAPFFLYHEDIEYSLRLKAYGYRVAIAPASHFYHDHVFSRNKDKFYFVERNRLGLLMLFFKLPTLVLLFPILFLWELGMLGFSVRRGWFFQKVQSYAYWLRPSVSKEWLVQRQAIQKNRVLTDRQLITKFAPTIVFNQGGRGENMIITFLVNPLFYIYYAVLRVIVLW